MTQYDAGPGDWSDREWEAPDHKSEPHAKRRRLVLPPWALLALAAGAVILLCVGLVLIVGAIRGGDDEGTPTPAATAALEILPTATVSLTVPTAIIIEMTPTVVLPTVSPTEPPPPAPAEVGPGAVVVVRGTGGTGLNLRAQPTTQSRRVATLKEGTELTVLDGPEEAGGYVWWQLQTADGTEGWGADRWLVLKPEQ